MSGNLSGQRAVQVHTETSVHRGQCERMHPRAWAPRKRRRLEVSPDTQVPLGIRSKRCRGVKRGTRSGADGKLEGVEQSLREDGGHGSLPKEREL